MSSSIHPPIHPSIAQLQHNQVPLPKPADIFYFHSNQSHKDNLRNYERQLFSIVKLHVRAINVYCFKTIVTDKCYVAMLVFLLIINLCQMVQRK